MFSIRRAFDLFFKGFKLTHPLRMAMYGAVVGVIAGLGAAGFFYLLEWATHYFLGVLAHMPPASPAGEHLFEETIAGAPIKWLFFLSKRF